MKTKLSWKVVGLASLGVAIAVFAAGSPQLDDDDKVTLCHVDEDNVAHTITVSKNGVPAHFPGHPDDYMGACTSP